MPISNTANRVKSFGSVTAVGAATGPGLNIASIVKGTAGLYTVNFLVPMATAEYFVTCAATSAIGSFVAARSLGGFTVTVRNSTPSLSDQPFSFLVIE